MSTSYSLEIYKKPLEAIQAGIKKVEIRTNNSYEQINYNILQVGDTISFQVISGPPFVGLDVIEADALMVEVVSVIKYRDPRELLKQEGLEVLSTLVSNIDDGVEILYSFHEYKEMIPIYGIYAIHFDLIQ